MDNYRQEQKTDSEATLQQDSRLHSAKRNIGRNALRVFVAAVLLAALLAGIVYLWIANTEANSVLDDKNEKIGKLEQQIADLKSAAPNQPADTNSNGSSTIDIRELGISITVPDSIKDLTYTYATLGGVNGDAAETVMVSTKTLTDLYDDNSCGTDSRPLGILTREEGQFDAGRYLASPPRLVKQFSGSYIVYSVPQAICGSDDPDNIEILSSALKDFRESLDSITETSEPST